MGPCCLADNNVKNVVLSQMFLPFLGTSKLGKQTVKSICLLSRKVNEIAVVIILMLTFQ